MSSGVLTLNVRNLRIVQNLWASWQHHLNMIVYCRWALVSRQNPILIYSDVRPWNFRWPNAVQHHALAGSVSIKQPLRRLISQNQAGIGASCLSRQQTHNPRWSRIAPLLSIAPLPRKFLTVVTAILRILVCFKIIFRVLLSLMPGFLWPDATVRVYSPQKPRNRFIHQTPQPRFHITKIKATVSYD